MDKEYCCQLTRILFLFQKTLIGMLKIYSGINLDYHVHVRNDILEETDGPMLKYGLQLLDKQKIILPNHRKDYPDRDRLEQRFERFLKVPA